MPSAADAELWHLRYIATAGCPASTKPTLRRSASKRLWLRLAEADEGWNCSPIATDQSAAQVTGNSGPPANTARQETATAERTCSSRGRPPTMAAAPFELQQGRRRLDAFVSLPRRAPLRIGRLDDYAKNKRISYEIEHISRNEMYGELMFHSIIVFFIAY